MIRTNCEKCVFNIHNQKEQIGCELNKLISLEKNGATLKKINQNFVIENRFCPCYRTEQWLKLIGDTDRELAVRAENIKTFEVLICIDKNEEINYEELEETIKDIVEKQILKPRKIIIVVNNDNVNYGKLIKKMQEINFPFSIEKIILNNIDMLDAIDIAIKKSNSCYYVIMKIGDRLEDEEFLANIDEAINEKMLRVLLVLPSKTRGYVISKILHEKLMGNTPCQAQKIDEECQNENIILNSLEEKVNYLAKKTASKIIFNYRELNEQSDNYQYR